MKVPVCKVNSFMHVNKPELFNTFETVQIIVNNFIFCSAY